MRPIIDMRNERYNRLIVLSLVGSRSGVGAVWRCRCECGTELNVTRKCLRAGMVQSCGCLHRRNARARLLVHGLHGSKLYWIWVQLRQRCTNPNNSRYPRYGGRGILVCPQWREDFKQFCDWAVAAGYVEGLTIDRKDNDGNYDPGNCQWLTRSEHTTKTNRTRHGTR